MGKRAASNGGGSERHLLKDHVVNEAKKVKVLRRDPLDFMLHEEMNIAG